jgi:Mrp family chromosome partitioning ATPase
MNPMLEALKQAEGAVPVPLAPGRRAATPAAIERFAFPELPDPQRPASAPSPPQAFWPECRDSAILHACAETAKGIVGQLSSERSMAVAFTSPGDGDGKTSSLLALAPELAKRMAGGVLVVDADHRAPNLTTRLGMPVSEAAERSAIYATNLPRLSVLPACPNWQSSNRDQFWIDELRQGWPLVVIDAASLAHTQVAPMARCCDGTYLVVRLGYTPRRAVAEAARVIRGCGGRLLGCVVVE